MLAKVQSGALIEVDGGLSSATLPLVYQAGARIVVAATSIFKYPQGIAAGIHALTTEYRALNKNRGRGRDLCG